MNKSDNHQQSPSEKLAALRIELIDLIAVNQDQPLTSAQSKTSAKSDHRVGQTDVADTVLLIRALLNGWSHNDLGPALFDVAEQTFKAYSKKRPFRLIGISLMVGAALVVIKPWRLLPKNLPMTLGSLIGMRLYKSIMAVLLKKY